MASDRDVQEQGAPWEEAMALAEIRERFLAAPPKIPAGRLLFAAALMLLGLWIGLFSWLGS